MVAAKASGCRVCRKVFCCTDCRDAHELNKHPLAKPKCSLCVSRTLAYDPSRDKNNAELIGHVLFNHLPLRCKLCGEVYVKSQDLLLSEPCRGLPKPDEKQQQPEIKTPIVSLKVPSIKSTSVNESTSDKLPHTPIIVKEKSLLRVGELKKQQLLQLDGNNSTSSSISNNNNNSKNKNLDSPPAELVRLTSTPMHGLVAPSPKQSNSSAILPHFALSKTPTSFDKRALDAEASSTSSTSSSSPSRYQTGRSDLDVIEGPLDRLHLSSVKSENHSEAELSCSILKKHSEPGRPSNNNDTMEKRVRFFDDQCQAVTESSSSCSSASCSNRAGNDSSTDNDVFYEAKESLDESKVVDASVCSSCPKSEDGEDENKNNLVLPREKENEEPIISTTTSSGNTVTSTSTTSSSRVLMMLVMEQTDSKTFSSRELHSLIDTGLKQLELKADDNNRELPTSDDKQGENNKPTRGLSNRIKHYSAEVTNISRQIDTESILIKDDGTQRTLIRDSCLNVTDRIECYQSTTSATPLRKQNETFCTTTNSSSGEATGGIFSAMARVVRSALNKLPVDMINNAISYSIPSPLANLVPTPPKNLSLSREPMTQTGSIGGGSSGSTNIINSTINVNSPIVSHFCAPSPARPAGVQRSAPLKRRRDSHEDPMMAFSTPRERNSPGCSSISSGGSSGSGSSGGGGGSSDQAMMSPALKRYRGRYRIRARQPIARMRQRQVLASPRGASLGTQRFQQGSLTIGDTLLPLPARAHQATQTEHVKKEEQ